MTASLFTPGRNVWQVARAERSGLLIDGRDYYRAVYEACARARHSILVVGWQFDSGVALLRGDDVPEGHEDPRSYRLLPFLDGLCRRNPDLRVDILAWDFSVVFAFERELLQRLVFDWTTAKNLRFHFDDHCPPTGSHHQKMVVVNHALAFAGGMDLCNHRWDDRAHAAVDPRRTDPANPTYGPYHEVQGFVTGEAARRLGEVFAARWRDAGLAPIPAHASPDEPLSHLEGLPSQPSIELGAAMVGIARTQVACAVPGEPVTEVRALLTDAILGAERLVYIETQYFTARAVLDALVTRVLDTARPPPAIVAILPHRPESAKEQLAVGIAQERLLDTLRETCARRGAPFGAFNVVSVGEGGVEVQEYIHAKVVIVDDRFLTVGSANLANRSMGLDTELNLAWSAPDAEGALADRIRLARTSLLAEHTGARTQAEVEALADARGLVPRLLALAQAGTSRLRLHDLVHLAPSPVLELFGEDALEALDPESPSKALFAG